MSSEVSFIALGLKITHRGARETQGKVIKCRSKPLKHEQRYYLLSISCSPLETIRVFFPFQRRFKNEKAKGQKSERKKRRSQRKENERKENSNKELITRFKRFRLSFDAKQKRNIKKTWKKGAKRKTWINVFELQIFFFLRLSSFVLRSERSWSGFCVFPLQRRNYLGSQRERRSEDNKTCHSVSLHWRITQTASRET